MQANRITIPEHEIEFRSIRAQGPGGQNVNKVASAIHLRFDIRASSLPPPVKQKLLDSNDQRVTSEGVILIKAQNHRTREKNRAEAIQRLHDMVHKASRVERKRIPTRPSKSSKLKRLDSKKRRGALKKSRSEKYE